MAISRLSVKTGGTGKAAAHAEYIQREGKYAKKTEQDQDLEYVAVGNMPIWAQHDSSQFWQAADLYERKNGSTYREYEIALPRELDVQHRIELVKEFVQQEIGEKYPYQLAIHNPQAMDGAAQPHVHLMFNERLQDGIERDPEQYFKRYNSKVPEKGGAKKDNTGKNPKLRREEIKDLRQRWEIMANKHLEHAGCLERIDMRSYAEQGIDKQPEKKLLPSQAKDPMIRHALTEQRHSEKVLQQIDLGDVQQALQQLKSAQQDLKKDIQHGIAAAKAQFAQFKAEQEQQRQRQEQQPNKSKDRGGMER